MPSDIHLYIGLFQTFNEFMCNNLFIYEMRIRVLCIVLYNRNVITRGFEHRSVSLIIILAGV